MCGKGGTCMVKGHAWQRGACVVKGGHAWQKGACMTKGVGVMKGGMCGRGCAWHGMFMAWDVHGRRHAWWGHAWQGGMRGRGHGWQGHVWQGACVAGETATATSGLGSMHLTGMHSCFLTIHQLS